MTDFIKFPPRTAPYLMLDGGNGGGGSTRVRVSICATTYVSNRHTHTVAKSSRAFRYVRVVDTVV